jgi:hypothetical protein
MGTSFIKHRTSDFFYQCLSLGSPLARVVTLSIGISVLAFVDAGSLKFPDFCIWERIFGYCPADGTTRALRAFFHGEWEQAMQYNLNILFVIPMIAGILVVDIFKLIKRRSARISSPDIRHA